MLYNQRIIAFLILSLIVSLSHYDIGGTDSSSLFSSNLSPLNSSPPNAEDLGMVFVHPGAVNSRADLDFVKAQIAAGQAPWTSAFNQMRTLAIQDRFTTAPTTENSQKSSLCQCPCLVLHR